ncbi:MAG: phosphatase PAP2 family protein [Candidatus Protochlamydia sp.]|nr:phosphatase PAP2 family protein [Candidatus Protochlamydia sp.]
MFEISNPQIYENIQILKFMNQLKTIFFPLLLLILLTPFSAYLDLTFANWSYQGNEFSTSPLLKFIFHYAIYPAWIVVGFSAFGLIGSYFYTPLTYSRRPFLYLLLVLAIGSGLIIHAILKDNWGRPRPRQVEEFGGKQSFRAYYEPNLFNPVEPSKSFPCGHCSMGFYFFTFVFLGKYYRRPLLSFLGWGLAFGLGGALSFARMAQGGHFFSDVLISALIMWLTALIIYHFLFKDTNFERADT